MALMEESNEFDTFNSEKSHNRSYKNNNRNKWTLYLFLCTLTVSLATFQFGYNISVLNGPKPIIKDFINTNYFLANNSAFQPDNETLSENAPNFKQTLDLIENEFNRSEAVEVDESKFVNDTQEIESEKNQNDAKIDNMWTLLNCLFVVGGMLGGLTSKFFSETFGRKRGILFHYMFSIAGSILVIVSHYFKIVECLLASRFLYGLHGGMACSMVPTYLAEVSPPALRGRTGVINQLLIVTGIFVGQVLGMKQILGNEEYWYILLAIPGALAVLAAFLFLIFFSDTPRNLLINNQDEISARQALQLLRHSFDVDDEIEEIKSERHGGEKPLGICRLLCSPKSLQWPLITSVVIHLTQQLSGINAIFFYSYEIFKNAQISQNLIQYAIMSTGLINFLATLISIPLIDRFGRRPLIIYPIIIMILNFIGLVLLLVYKDSNEIFPLLSVACVCVFVFFYAIGLGSIPFVYTAECFTQNARGAAMSICVFLNWSAALLLTLTFEYLQKLIQHYVFVVFVGVFVVSLLILFPKMPETKGKTFEQIAAKFNKQSRTRGQIYRNI